MALELTAHRDHGERGERAPAGVVAVDRIYQPDAGHLLKIVERLPAAGVAARHPAGEGKAAADQVIAESVAPRCGGGSPGVGVSGRQLVEIVETLAGNWLSKNWHPGPQGRDSARLENYRTQLEG